MSAAAVPATTEAASALSVAQQQASPRTAVMEERAAGESEGTVRLENMTSERRDAEGVVFAVDAIIDTETATTTPPNSVWSILLNHAVRCTPPLSPFDVRSVQARSRPRIGRARCLVCLNLVLISAFVIFSTTVSPPNGE